MRREIAVVAVLLVALPGCRAWRRRHRGAGRATVVQRDPRAVVATACYDARYVTGPRVAMPFGQVARTGVPSAALFGGRLAVGWNDPRGVMLALEGGRSVVTVAAGVAASRVLIAADEAGVTVLWQLPHEAGFAVAMLDPALAVVGRWVSPEPWWGATLARSGDVTLVAGVGSMTTAVPMVFAQLLDARGRELGPRRPFGGPRGGESPAVCALRDGWSLGWLSRNDGPMAVRLARLGARGERWGDEVVIDRPGTELRGLAIGCSPTRVALAWADRRSGDWGLQITTATLRGQPSGWVQRLSARLDPERAPWASIAWDGGAFGVAWWEPVSGGSDRAFAALVDPDGHRLGSGMRVAMEDETGLRHPTLLWSAMDYRLCLAREDGGIELRRTGPRLCDAPLGDGHP